MKVDAVLETCMYAENLDVTGAFYERVLGLEPFSRVEGRHVFFRCGRAVFLLFNPVATERSEDVPPHGARGAGHVAFSVPAAELDGWQARLHAAGVPIESEVRWPRGGRSLYLRDPAGNCVELASPGIWGLNE